MAANSCEYDLIVVGAGHAGCEAALAAARLGCRTLLCTISLEAVAQMSCNPAIGGSAKGILVREIDALGGAQGWLADQSGIQFRMLNRSRGPAVQAPRAQCDKRFYALLMKRLLETTPNLTLRQDLVEELVLESTAGPTPLARYSERLKFLRAGAVLPDLSLPAPDSGALRVTGVLCASGLTYNAAAVVLTTGTFLRGLIHHGTQQTPGGRAGEIAAQSLSGSLVALGLELGRLKTGTPPRLNGRTIAFDALTPQWGDEPAPAFSFRTTCIDRPRLPCWLSRTTARTHQLIRDNLHRAPLFSGQITSRGPRYCPSIEDKIVRFAEKDSHQIFLEPEGAATEEYYVNGLSTSLPPEVQFELVRSIPGCADAEILRFGYAIEYDMVRPCQISPAFSTRAVPNLFLAGQINGTSGYEEAAGQGLLAGINAALAVRDPGAAPEPFILRRDEAYLGLMADDLVTKDLTEPYRLFTSRSEFRLLLRQDNADRRLAGPARRWGLLPPGSLEATAHKEAQIMAATACLQSTRPPGSSKTYWDLLRQPEMTFSKLLELGAEVKCPPAVAEAVQIEAKYQGYFRRQEQQVERLKHLEERLIPGCFDFSRVHGLKREAREKLSRHRPRTFGQALRLEGVTPADVSLLSIFLAQIEG